jgi:hypothetical protein
MGSIKIEKGEYTVTQWSKKHSELNQTNPDEQDDLLEDDLGRGVMDSGDISPNDITDVMSNDNFSHLGQLIFKLHKQR